MGSPAAHVIASHMGLPGKLEGAGVHQSPLLASSIPFASLLLFTLSIKGARSPPPRPTVSALIWKWFTDLWAYALKPTKYQLSHARVNLLLN